MENKTATQWLIEQLLDRQNGRAYGSNLDEIFEQAKEMEKQQIEDAKKEGYDFATSEAIKEINKNYNL